jgi:hypothetical protein
MAGWLAGVLADWRAAVGELGFQGPHLHRRGRGDVGYGVVEFLPDGIARFHDRFGDDARVRSPTAPRAAHKGIPITLAAIKKTAESD